jgi:Ser/Thr protein kinase RdoA (MazF antagonist)
MDLFCNERLVYDITKALKPMLLQMEDNAHRYKASIKGYHRRVWFDKNDVNIICQASEETVQDHLR